jgi:hypothetical protein
MEAEDRPVALSRLQRRLVRLLAPAAERSEILADLAEEATAIAAEHGRSAAATFVRWQLWHSARPWLRRRVAEAIAPLGRVCVMNNWGLESDIRIAARRLWQLPGYALLAVATFAIGIGAVSTAFALAHALWLKPLPYAHPERLVRIATRHVPTGASWSLTSLEFDVFRRPGSAIKDAAGFSYGAQIARINDQPLRIVAYRVSPNLFRVLGVRPAHGRDFRDDEGAAGATVAMLSDAAWTKRFGRDPAIVGKTLTLSGSPYEVVGIMPRGFSFPRGVDSDIFLPVDLAAHPEQPMRAVEVIARLADGESIAGAEADV